MGKTFRKDKTDKRREKVSPKRVKKKPKYRKYTDYSEEY